MKPLISFIIPAFNASSTIARCLDSIYSIPLLENEFEVIVIDDCSTDNTIEIIEQYRNSNQNLILLLQSKNHRQGAARNRGMEVAKGEYILFVDSDDEIVAEGIINSLNVVKESKAEVCYFDFMYENTKNQWVTSLVSTDLTNKIVDSDYYLDNYYNCLYNAPWRTIIQREFLSNLGIKFIEDVQFEDGDWTIKVYLAAKKIQFVSGIGYKYYWGLNATSRKTSVESIYQRVFAGVRLLQIAESTHLSQLKNTLVEYVQYTSFPLLRLRNLTKYAYHDIRQLLHRLNAPTYIHTYIHTYARTLWQRQILAKHLLLAKCILFFACPIAAVGRKMLNIKRKLL